MAARSRTAAVSAGAELPTYKCGRYGHRSKRTGRPCRQNVVQGTHHCPHHAGKSLEQHRAEGQIRLMSAEFAEDRTRWTPDGHDGGDIDPKAEILRMIAFWKWKTNFYGSLLQEAYAAAERLAATKGSKADGIVTLNEPDWESDPDGDGILPEHPALQVIRQDLQTIFTRGGVTALVGHKYDADRNGRVFAVDEGIRGLVDLESRAHDKLLKCLGLANSAKVAEAKVALAEQAGVMIQAVILGTLRDLAIAADDRVMRIIAANIDAVAGSPALNAA